MKKYEMTDETKVVNGRTLHRIRALKDFADVKAGDLGGFIQYEDNLSQEGNCWIYDNACVFGKNAKVFENAKVHDDAWVYGNARVYGKAYISDNAKVYYIYG